MLSRTADHLFWMARYMERAENTARMLDVNYQMSLLPQSEGAAERGWRGLLSINEIGGDFAKRHGEVTPRSVIDYMVSEPKNGTVLLTPQASRGVMLTKCTARVSPGRAVATNHGPVCGLSRRGSQTSLGRSVTVRTRPPSSP